MNRREILKLGLSTAATGLVVPALPGLLSSTNAQAAMPAFGSHRAVENSVYYNGTVFSFLADSKATGGNYAMYEVFVRQGLEPPPHAHPRGRNFLPLGGRSDLPKWPGRDRSESGRSRVSTAQQPALVQGQDTNLARHHPPHAGWTRECLQDPWCDPWETQCKRCARGCGETGFGTEVKVGVILARTSNGPDKKVGNTIKLP
jgi:hypothetical protein